MTYNVLMWMLNTTHSVMHDCVAIDVGAANNAGDGGDDDGVSSITC